MSSKSDTARPVARAARASRRALCGEGGASVCAPDSEGGASMVGDSVKNACCDNFPCALFPPRFYAIYDAVACASTLPNGLTPYAVVRVCDNGSNVAQELDLALLEP